MTMLPESLRRSREGGASNEQDFVQIFQYFDDLKASLLNTNGSNTLMANLRALSRAVRQMSGIQMLLTLKMRT